MADEFDDEDGVTLSDEELASLRRTVRKLVLWAAKIEAGGRNHDCVVVDLSLGGARLHMASPIAKGESVLLTVQRFGAFRAEVAWEKERSIGIRFMEDQKRILDLIGHHLPLATVAPKAVSA
jgi:hypothetical protein